MNFNRSVEIIFISVLFAGTLAALPFLAVSAAAPVN